jgi:flavin reductase (DIM6/NTAB) family NADH-FMN oxidoreductase RutF
MYKMEKKELTPQCLIPVRPILIIGANVGGKANFFTVGGGGPVSSEPPMIALPIRHQHYTLTGILDTRAFSVNIPSVQLVREADYCGIVSGKKTDKIKDCNFNIFYGKFTNAPMIEQCSINMECSLQLTINSFSHAIIIGQIASTYISQGLILDNKPEFDIFSPLLWFVDRAEYVTVGKAIGKSTSIGNDLKRLNSDNRRLN